MHASPHAANERPLALLRALTRRLEDYGLAKDARTIASVILETARELDWGHDPRGVPDWLSQLAVELVQTSPV